MENKTKIDNKDFLKFFKERCKSNVTYIKSIRFNKKSISIKMDNFDRNFVFNDFFTEKSLYNLIISYLSIYIKENEIKCFNTVGLVYDIDYLKYVYEKLNINYI